MLSIWISADWRIEGAYQFFKHWGKPSTHFWDAEKPNKAKKVKGASGEWPGSPDFTWPRCSRPVGRKILLRSVPCGYRVTNDGMYARREEAEMTQEPKARENEGQRLQQQQGRQPNVCQKCEFHQYWQQMRAVGEWSTISHVGLFLVRLVTYTLYDLYICSSQFCCLSIFQSPFENLRNPINHSSVELTAPILTRIW